MSEIKKALQDAAKASTDPVKAIDDLIASMRREKQRLTDAAFAAQGKLVGHTICGIRNDVEHLYLFFLKDKKPSDLIAVSLSDMRKMKSHDEIVNFIVDDWSSRNGVPAQGPMQ